MIPKKIYLREADFDDLFTSERMVACEDKGVDGLREQILHAVWSIQRPWHRRVF